MVRFPIIYQHDSMQCGIACLQMVCKYFGREYSLDSLTKLCFATTEGVSLLGINEAANTLGLHTTCARATTIVLGEAPLLAFFIGTKITLLSYIRSRKERSSMSLIQGRDW